MVAERPKVPPGVKIPFVLPVKLVFTNSRVAGGVTDAVLKRPIFNRIINAKALIIRWAFLFVNTAIFLMGISF